MTDYKSMFEQAVRTLADRALLERMLAAMEGVIDVADRQTDEFEALRSCVIDLTVLLFSKSAPARDYPPLPDFDTIEQHIYGACRRYITQDMLEPIHNLIRETVDADRAACATADSVLEDAARLDFLIEQQAYVVSDPDACPGYWLHWVRPDGSKWAQVDEHPTPRAAIDAARKQGANHDQ